MTPKGSPGRLGVKGNQMKSRVVSIVVMLALGAAQAVGQTSDNAGASGNPTAQRAPSGAGAAPAHDPAVELAFWETVKDSGDPMLYLAYLEQFPNGAFRVIARNRLDAQWEKAIRAFALLEQMGVSLDDATAGPVVVDPPKVVNPTPKPPPAAPSWQRIRNTQNQLRNHNCYKGGLDGVWGPGRRRR